MPERVEAAKQFRLLADQIGEPASAARLIAQAKNLERRSTKDLLMSVLIPLSA